MTTAITVSIDWSDYLAETLPFNRKHFDKYILVTVEEDEKTHRLATDYSCQIRLVHKQVTFNKGLYVNAGISTVKAGWICLLDGDIVLPFSTNMSKLIFSNLDEECIYGTDRLAIKSYDHWQQVKPLLGEDDYTSIPNAELMKRFYFKGRGWMPIGFFQLFHSKHNRLYPEEMTEAFHQDVPFARQWPRSKSVFLPEATVLHLETPDAALRGINWFGRSTMQFGGSMTT